MKRVKIYCIIYCIDIVCLYFSTGFVSITYPMNQVPYRSTPTLSCTFKETTFDETDGSWNWNLIKGSETFVLNTGTSITVTFPEASPNCTTVQIKKLSGNWAGVSERPMMLANINRGSRIIFPVYVVIVNSASDLFDAEIDLLI